MAKDPAAGAGVCITLLVAVSLAGCMGPPAQSAGCETFADLRDGAGDLRAACVGKSVSLEGFFLANATASTARFIGGSSVSSTVIEEELPQTTNWTVGLFLNASFLADIEDPEGIVRDHGALVALPNFTVRHNLTYLQLDGRVRDVDQVLENRSQVNATFPLVIAETYDRLSPEHHTLQELAREFEAIVGTEPVRHIRTRGFGFGTTPAHLQAAQGNGDSDALLDVGIYELSDATYQAAPDDVQTYRIPMVRLTVGQGTELLGDRVRVHGFLVNTETLQGEVQTRAEGLPRVADDRPTLRSRMEEAHQRAGGDLPVPILDDLVDRVGQARADHHRIPAVFVAYRITPLPPEMDAPLQDLDPQPVPEDDLLVHLGTEGYASGTTLETVCQAAQPGCDLPYDVGIYELVNFTVADDNHLTPHVYEVPVVYPVKDRAPNYLAAPVDVEGVWVTEDVGRNAMQAFLADSPKGAGWGELLANPSARGQLSSWLTSVEGFIYAYEVNRRPPLHQAPTPVLLWASNATGDTVKLRWTRTVDDNFDRYEVHRSDRPVLRYRSQDRVTTIQDINRTTYSATELDTQGRFFKVYVWDQDNLRSRSNIEEVNGSDGTNVSITLQNVTRCPDNLQECLRVKWSGYDGEGFQRYVVFRHQGDDVWKNVTTIHRQAQTTFRDMNLTCGTTYTYKVRLETARGTATSGTESETPEGPGGYCE